jgi:hypothetical protein
MNVVTRRIPVPFNATGEIATDEVDTDAGISYSCLFSKNLILVRHNDAIDHHNDDFS